MSAKSERAGPSPDRSARACIVLALSALAAAWLWSGAVQACDLAVTQAPTPIRIDYNPFAIGSPAGPLDVKFQNRGEGSCDLRLSFTDDAGQEATQVVLGGVGLQFRPRESSGVTEAPAQPGVFLFTLAAGETGEAQLDAAVLRDAVAEAGEYAVDLKLSVKDAAGQALIAPIPVRLVLSATPRAQLNLAGAAGVFGSGSSVEVVDFGEAVTGATRQIFVQVRANARSTLTIKSEHQGQLRRVEAVEGAPPIAYAVDLDGQPVDLTATWSRSVDPPRTLEGQSLPMTFTLGDVLGRAAGRYADLITIDVSPK